MDNQQKAQQSDEIDLIELIHLLWNKKKTIIVTTVICVLIAAGYAFTTKEQWTSKAEVLPPTIVSMDNFYNLKKEYSKIMDIEFDPKAQEQLIKNAYSKFNELIYSIDRRESFFLKTSLFKQESNGKSEEEKQKILYNLAHDSINIVQPDLKKDPNTVSVKISLQAEKADLAQNTLKAFIAESNKAAFTEIFAEFLVRYYQAIEDLKFELDKIKQSILSQRKIQLENLNKALNIAKEAGIVNYIESLDTKNNIFNIIQTDTKISLSDSKLSDSPYLFMLGEKYLKAQIDTLEDSKEIYPPRYYEVESKLAQLELLAKKFDAVKADSFIYLSSPDYPVVKDKPKKLLILIAGAIVGLILSIIVILLSNSIIKRNFVKKLDD